MKIVYSNFTRENFNDDENFMSIVNNSYLTCHYRGFYYFSPDHIHTYGRNNENKVIFFLAFKNEVKPQNIIGVLKTSVYQYNEKEKSRNIDYIDINKNFFRKGIAGKLLERLDDYVKSEEGINIIISSSLSNQGRKKGLKALLEKKLSHFKNFN